MSDQPLSGPQFRADRPAPLSDRLLQSRVDPCPSGSSHWVRPGRLPEQEAVRTTIVGGRPPGSGQPVGPIPRGLEVLVKKAAVDPPFRELLLTQRAAAAEQIGLTLDPSEALMLAAVPASQLQAIIAQTTVPQEHRRAFFGQAAAAMLAVLGVTAEGCGPPGPPAPTGSRPDKPGVPDSHPGPTKGIRPDEPPVTGIRPDKPAVSDARLGPTKGIRPDKPPVPNSPSAASQNGDGS